MGRLSTFAKNRILNLRFQKNFRIKQIASTLQEEDSIKVSRKSISTFLKKYIETKSIHDKPRSGRNKKLTQEEIQLIGEVTRLNRDITAPKIKEYLNLNVSTYTILRASKLFEWNKLNPNSNEAKRAAAMERQLINGEAAKTRRSSSGSGGNNLRQVVKREPTTLLTSPIVQQAAMTSSSLDDMQDSFDELENDEHNTTAATTTSNTPQLPPVHVQSPDLNLVEETEVLKMKNESSSAMVFATKLLHKTFELHELLGHNISGKTFNRHIKNKQALDERRIAYIRWLVENHYDHLDKEQLWKGCRTAINKSIRNSELKFLPNQHKVEDSASALTSSAASFIEMTPTSLLPTVEQMIEDPSALSSALVVSKSTRKMPRSKEPTIASLTSYADVVDDLDEEEQENGGETTAVVVVKEEVLAEPHPNNLKLVSARAVLDACRTSTSPMIFASKILLKVFNKDELVGHNISGKTYHKNQRDKEPLDEKRITYIKWLVEQCYPSSGSEEGGGEEEEAKRDEEVWKSCRKAINRVIRNCEIKDSKLIRILDDDSSFQDCFPPEIVNATATTATAATATITTKQQHHEGGLSVLTGSEVDILDDDMPSFEEETINASISSRFTNNKQKCSA